MSIQIKALLIAATWATFFALFSINKFVISKRLVGHNHRINLSTDRNPAGPPGTFPSKAGVLLVFAVNIFTVLLVLLGALSSSINNYLSPVKISLPLSVNIAGSLLFVIGNAWGFFAMVFNPDYTPLYRTPPQHFILATHGPYGIIRHPRYVSEAFLNIALFLFTGIWLPLLGLIGWAAIYHQARAEESFLMSLAAKEYGEYCKRTSMFFPKFRSRHAAD